MSRCLKALWYCRLYQDIHVYILVHRVKTPGFYITIYYTLQFSNRMSRDVHIYAMYTLHTHRPVPLI